MCLAAKLEAKESIYILIATKEERVTHWRAAAGCRVQRRGLFVTISIVLIAGLNHAFWL